MWLEDLDLSKMTCGWHEPQRAKSVGGTPITIHKTEYRHGVGTHAYSEMLVQLNGAAKEFISDVGIDDESGTRGTVRFEIWVDGRKAAQTNVMHGGDEPAHLDVPLNHARTMLLVADGTEDGIDNDHADWADARIVYSGNRRPVSIKQKVEPPMPIYQGSSAAPEINGARIVGCSPGMPFLFKIPVSGRGPLHFAVANLPPVLSVDSATGIIQGAVTSPGTYKAEVEVAGPAGKAHRELTIVCGEHKLALTPPMGWNSWNVWGTSVTADKVRAAAQAFIKEGLDSYGYRYVNIDDAWEGQRDANGNIQTNEKFGDMGELANWIHQKGLLLGIYSSPGPKTCAGYEASYQHEQQDADTYAKWGIDYLKYDWCSYGSIAPNPTLDQLKEPYIHMRSCLDQCGRDIVFSLCQYGMGDVWNWGKSVGGNLWRTTGDINDSWNSMAEIAFSQSKCAPGAGPGGWNDPDMLVVGHLGWGEHPHPTGLTPNEQITHITMWSLLAAPLILGCDLSTLDPWTKALITNHDVIDIDQDPLGKPATRLLSTDEGAEVWSRPLWDGSVAVGLMNRGRTPMKITATMEQLGLSGRKHIRDCWLRQDIGMHDHISTEIASHGAKLYRVR